MATVVSIFLAIFLASVVHTEASYIPDTLQRYECVDEKPKNYCEKAVAKNFCVLPSYGLDCLKSCNICTSSTAECEDIDFYKGFCNSIIQGANAKSLCSSRYNLHRMCPKTCNKCFSRNVCKAKRKCSKKHGECKAECKEGEREIRRGCKGIGCKCCAPPKIAKMSKKLIKG